MEHIRTVKIGNLVPAPMEHIRTVKIGNLVPAPMEYIRTVKVGNLGYQLPWNTLEQLR